MLDEAHTLPDWGGALERISGPDEFTAKWKRRLGMTAEEFDAAAGQVDRAAPPTQGPPLTERAEHQSWVAALGLSEAESDEFMRDLWDWYCGELDTDLMTVIKPPSESRLHQ